MSALRTLILGGTAEGREIASALHAAGTSVISSLAGRVVRPRLPEGEVRMGGFGGPEAMARWLDEHEIEVVIDATHPFAERISKSAVWACREANVSLLRLERPGWESSAGDRWLWVEDLQAAAALVADTGRRVFLTTGRQGLSAFKDVHDAWFLMRCVDPPDPPLPPRSQLLLDRGPYTLDGELEVIDRHEIDLLVTKDSGGLYTRPKLDAARIRSLPVIVVRRPGRSDVETVGTVEEALRWVTQRSALA